MKRVLVDSSLWIGFFKGESFAHPVVSLLEKDVVVTNSLILSELIPSILQKKEQKIYDLLNLIPKIPLTIDWTEIIQMQTKNVSHGINRVGIPDLIITQNAIQQDVMLYHYDKHFEAMKTIHPVQIFTP